ncbi:hypothetical protein KUTeg_019479 [Tegillarca granosa]|uniref:Uncharacterized protein n=1 Tax=Tegillarca granosa TaxID=220873 RepID=A0ABQ9ECN8_TEGGR|nr:hypothetical protein KUTeg_019479 [Tegillarca granosa]
MSFIIFLDESFLNKFLGLGVTASVTITVGSLIVVVVCIVAIACCCKRSFCKQSPDTTTTGTTSTSNTIVANGTTPSYPPGHTNINTYTNPYTAPHPHQGYYPMQPVFQPPTHGSLMFSGYNRDVYTNSGSAYSSHSQSHPPSHHRSYTPTSSRSGKSVRSNNSTSVTYSQTTDKVSLPVNL